jgi:hypothetical protein
MKLRFYPAIVAVLSLALLVLLLSRLEISWRTESVVEDTTASPSLPPAIPDPPQPQPASPTPTPTPLPSATPSPPIASPTAATAARTGSLRVSNQTIHPVRVALLPQTEQTPRATENALSLYREPVHWDFAPEEGSSRGLKLSLPNGDLLVQEGDVVVAFAQDGSRRYWGPYVVGKTAAPNWNAESAEWQFVLQP